MSRRKHRHRYNESRNDKWPKPPQKTIRCRHSKPHRRRVNTEVHDAFWSCGKINRTGRLSDSEFNSQVKDEIGYLFRLSGAHAKNAWNALSDMFNNLF